MDSAPPTPDKFVSSPKVISENEDEARLSWVARVLDGVKEKLEEKLRRGKGGSIARARK